MGFLIFFFPNPYFYLLFVISLPSLSLFSLSRIKSAIFTVNSAITNLQQAYLQLSSSITGRGNTRCLFTNAYPKLGLLTNSLHEVSQIFLLLNDNFDTLKVLLNEQVENILLPLQHLFHENLIEKRKKYEKLSELFEQKILSTLNTRNISLNTEQEICNLRMEYELNRYDYVVKLNQNNCHKKYLLTKV